MAANRLIWRLEKETEKKNEESISIGHNTFCYCPCSQCQQWTRCRLQMAETAVLFIADGAKKHLCSFNVVCTNLKKKLKRFNWFFKRGIKKIQTWRQNRFANGHTSTDVEGDRVRCHPFIGIIGDSFFPVALIWAFEYWTREIWKQWHLAWQEDFPADAFK